MTNHELGVTNMALITRFSRLFRADLHAVLDRIEEPEVILRQAVREMEEEIVADEQRHKLLAHELKHMAAQQTELQQGIVRAQDELEVCLDADNDDLARSQLRRKLEAEQLLQFRARQQAEISHKLSELNSRLQQNRGRLTAMQQKLDLLVNEERHYRQDASLATPDFCVRDEDVEVALLREKQKRRQV
jgi:phage shock protein A